VIEIHSSAIYRIYLIGFLPGFTYLGGLDKRIATSRRLHPRAKIPSGTIMIGGEQAGIAPMDMPSGWHNLGRTPVRTYAPERDPAFLFAAGDELVFEPVDASRWGALEKAALAGEPVAEEVRP
jgi:KipI family sensor histidine kinase inhibitor